MKDKSILFIEPAGNKTNVFDSYMRLPLMGSLYLGTILHNHGYRVQILNENILSGKVDPLTVPADVYCITALTVSAGRARLLAQQLKERYPTSLVIVGGIHASLLPEEFTDVADHVVIGEAEEIILDIVEGRYREKIIHGREVADLDTLPLVNYSLLAGMGHLNSIPIMTSRGCPFDCNFCTVTKIFGRKFRMQSPQRIVEEIENALAYFKTKSIFFYDDNLSANRERINNLCDLLIEKKLGISWAAQVRSDLARDTQLVEKMVSAGLWRVYIGFESIDDETLKALHKAQTRADIERAIAVFHDWGVRIHGMFMFGEDHDTVQSISRTVQFAIDNEIDTVQFMILTPFPGTQCYDKLAGEYSLLHEDWDYYNGMFAVFSPRNMSPEALINETYKAYRTFYSARRTLRETIFLLINVLIDALVWNREKVNQYNLDIMFLRGGARVIISKYAAIYGDYLEYLKNRQACVTSSPS